MSATKPYIGGQAVLEGVMMRAPGCMTVAVRRPDGAIALQEGPVTSKLAATKLWKLPGFRGVATLVESMSLGMRALQFSASQILPPEEAGENAGGAAVWLSMLIALAMFIALPQGLAAGAQKLFHFTLTLQDPRFHLLTGAFKLLVLTTYLFVISRVPDVRRVFQYHGAEHKTIFAYEAGLPLTVENVQKQSTLHPRCGTTFLIVVVIVSILVGSIATPLLLPHAAGLSGQAMTLALRISLLPLIAAISYELQRLTARYCTTGPMRVLLWPGFLFQKITTREPDDAQVEIAISAMEAAVWRERVGAKTPSSDAPLIFDSFEKLVAAARSELHGISEVAS